VRTTRRLAALATAAALGVTLGLAATAQPVKAATPSCGFSCVELINRYVGFQFDSDVTGAPAAGAVMQHAKVIFWARSNADRGQDFFPDFQGTVHDFFLAGLVSGAFDLHFHADPAFEIQYSPDGDGTGLCVGTWPGTPLAGFKLRLEPCGVGPWTVWAFHRFPGSPFPWFSLLDAAGTNFSNPLVLTYPAGAFPTDFPRPWPVVDNLHRFALFPFPVIDRQLFRLRVGINP